MKISSEFRRKHIFPILNKLPKKWVHSYMRRQLNLEYKFPENFVLKIAETPDEIEQAFRLLHTTYVERGLIDRHDEEIRLTKYHILPTTTLLIAKLGDDVLGTISHIMDSPLGLPVDELWDLSRFRNEGRRIAEISSFGIKRGPLRKGTLIFPMVRALINYAQQITGTDMWVMATHPNVKEFYAGLFGFEPIDDEVKEYPFVKGALAYGQMLDVRKYKIGPWLEATYNHLPEAQNLFQYYIDERLVKHIQLPEHPYFVSNNFSLSPEQIEHYFNDRTSVLRELQPQHRAALQKIYNFPNYMNALHCEDSFSDSMPREARFAVACPTTFYDADRGSLFAGQAMDVSEGGIKIRTRYPLALNRTLKATVQVGPQKNVQVELIPRWQKSSGVYGCEIKTVRDPNWNNFMDYLNRLAEHPSSAAEVLRRSA